MNDKRRIREFPPHPYWDYLFEGDHRIVATRLSNLMEEYHTYLTMQEIIWRKQPKYDDSALKLWKMVDEIKIEREYRGDDSPYDFWFFRDETEEEKVLREKQELEQKTKKTNSIISQEKAERALYAKLKKKYGP